MQVQKMLTLASEVKYAHWHGTGGISIRQFIAKGYQKEKKPFKKLMR